VAAHTCIGEQQVLDSALIHFPIIGDELNDPQGLHGSAAVVVVGGLVARYGALGVAHAHRSTTVGVADA
jgi:hypothetical protein